MSQPYEATLISEYWFRTFAKSKLFETVSISDITKIIALFGGEDEEFDKEFLFDPAFEIINNGKRVQMKIPQQKPQYEKTCHYGHIIAKPGRKYHWKLKKMKGIWNMGIGIIRADKIKRDGDEIYLYDIEEEDSVGAVWFGGGTFYCCKDLVSSNDMIMYGNAEMDIWLDLMNDFDIEFANNGKKYGKKGKMKADTEYRLIVITRSQTVDIVEFDITYKSLY